MAKIFLSYRRNDTSYIAQTLCNRLQNRFGRRSVFFDIDTIPPGVDFRERIRKAVGQCDVLLVVIGDKWLTAVDDQGERRLDKLNDLVRIEVESALHRNIPVIPVLVDRAELPKEDDLPEGLRGIVHRNCAELRAGPDLDQHYERIIRGVEEVVPPPLWIRLLKDLWNASKQVLNVFSATRFSTSRRKIMAILAVLLLLLCAIGLFCVAHFYPSRARQISHVGVAFQDAISRDKSARRALELYQKKFPSTYPKFSYHEIQLKTGSPDDLNNKVFGVIGKLTSEWAIGEVAKYEDGKLVYISPGATNLDVTSDRKYVFSMNFDDRTQGRMIANFLKYVLGCESVAVVSDGKSYSRGLLKGFEQVPFSSCHPVPLDTSKNFPKDFVQKLLQLDAHHNNGVQAIVLLLESWEAANLTKELRVQDFKKIIICPESCFKQSFIDDAGEDHSNLYVATPLVEGFGTKQDLEFRREFMRDDEKEVPLWSIFAYEAVDLLMQTHLNNPNLENYRRESERIRKIF